MGARLEGEREGAPVGERLTMGRHHALMLAVLLRVKKVQAMLAFSQEWWQLGEIVPAARLSKALIESGIGFVCRGCREGFAGLPNYFKTDGQRSEALCTSCAQAEIAKHRAR